MDELWNYTTFQTFHYVLFSGTSSKEVESDFELKKCEGCQKEFKPTSLNRHIARSAQCKEHYGDEFEEMKKSARVRTNKANHDKNADVNKKRQAAYDETKYPRKCPNADQSISTILDASFSIPRQIQLILAPENQKNYDLNRAFKGATKNRG